MERRAASTASFWTPVIPQPGAIVLPGWTVGYVAPVPGGAHPSYALGYSSRDNDYYVAWTAISRDRERIRRWLATEVLAA